MNNIIKGFNDTIAWYNANAQKYAENIEDVPSLDYLDEFSDIAGEGSAVMDAGCASGRDTNLLRQRGLMATGLDLSKSLLDIARQRYPDLEFIEGNFLELPFKNNNFDGIWAHASLLHLESTEDVTKALSEFNRVLKSGGIIHIFVKQQQGSEKTSIVSDSLSGHDRFFQWFSKNEMQDLLRKTQFTILKIEDDIPDPAGRPEINWIRVLALNNKS
jgi:ubiquinone/menaquinone biosynthesis C-methylase UbiE